MATTSLIDELASCFNGIERKLDECIRLKEAEFDLVKEHVESLDENASDCCSMRLNDMRDELLRRNQSELENAMIQVKQSYHISIDCHALKMRQDEMSGLLANIYFLKKFRFNVSTKRQIYLDRLYNMFYINELNMFNKIKYLHIYNEYTELDLNDSFANKHVVPLSKTRLFTFDLISKKMSIVDQHGRSYREASGNVEKEYKEFKAYDRHILLYGSWPNKSIFIDIYDLDLDLKASRDFHFREFWLAKVEHVNAEQILFRHFISSVKRYIIFDYTLKELRSFTENSNNSLKPFYFDGGVVQQFTADYLFIYCWDMSQVVKSSKQMLRTLDIHTGRELSRIKLEQRQFVKFVFSWHENEPIVIYFRNKRIKLINLVSNTLLLESTSESNILFEKFENFMNITAQNDIYYINMNNRKCLFL